MVVTMEVSLGIYGASAYLLLLVVVVAKELAAAAAASSSSKQPGYGAEQRQRQTMTCF
jgi:hypothetical protein